MENPDTGEVHAINARDAYQLMQIGLTKIGETQEEPKKEPEIEQDEPTRIKNLEDKIKNMEEKTATDKQNQAILHTINSSAAKFDMTKNDGKLATKIKILALARLQHNPRLNVEELFAEEVKDFMEIQAERDKVTKDTKVKNAKVAATVSGMISSEGGMPVIDTAKEWKAEDLKTNVAREAMRKVIENLD